MIWGFQWNLACDFISKKGEKKSIRNATTWANYKNSTGDADIKLIENGQEEQKYGSKQVTGYSEYWKANNIYDLAGNCTEFTQEAASGTGFRSVRGGGCNRIEYAPYMRSNYGPDDSRDFLRFTS